MTSTINPTSPSPARAKAEPQHKANDNTRKWVLIVAAVAVVVAAAIAIIASRGDNGEGAREVTRSKAEAVLRARFNDTMKGQGVPELKSMTVVWKGDQLVATWTQGEAAQKRCTAPVLVSPDGQSFGIAAFQAVPFDKQDSAPATCVSTEGLQYGLPLG